MLTTIITVIVLAVLFLGLWEIGRILGGER
jgi:hypothetical protein